MANWLIRPALFSDAAALAALGQRTFRETFTHYPEAELAPYLAAEYSTDIFSSYLSDPETKMWLAEDGGKAVAYSKLGAYKLPLTPVFPPVIELHRLYVQKSHRGKKIGAALMALAFDTARAQGAQAMYLGVWEHNFSAQNFYARYGFAKTGEYDYPPIGSTHDREWIMRKPL